MFTCFIRYAVDSSKIKEFEEYARTWIALITKHGGIHHGYFLPEDDLTSLPNQAFSFPDLGKTGPANIAVAFFSFPSLEAYEAYKKSITVDKECEDVTAKFKETKCFLSYERNFLRPIFNDSITTQAKQIELDRNLLLTQLEDKDIDEIVLAFKNIGWNKPKTTYKTYLDEQIQNHLVVFVAKLNNTFCGYVTLKWCSDYQQFKRNNIPEIADLNVLPGFRKIGIGAKLIQACESIAKEHGHNEIGIGVGMTADYGNAQRLYTKLGYVPDGQGLYYKNKKLHYFDVVTIDDDLVLYFTKKLDLQS